MKEIAPVDSGSDARPTTRQRDFLLLTVFVLAQHGYVERAGVLLEALHLLSPPNTDILFGRAVLRFFRRDYAAALACLDELDRFDPIERFGRYRLTERQRMRRFLKARCLFELREDTRAREAVEVYLRHGEATLGDDVE
jgi:hypothetical protein